MTVDEAPLDLGGARVRGVVASTLYAFSPFPIEGPLARPPGSDPGSKPAASADGRLTTGEDRRAPTTRPATRGTRRRPSKDGLNVKVPYGPDVVGEAGGGLC